MLQKLTYINNYTVYTPQYTANNLPSPHVLHFSGQMLYINITFFHFTYLYINITSYSHTYNCGLYLGEAYFSRSHVWNHVPQILSYGTVGNA